MKLLIVESPTKAKTIGKYLGSDYEVIASVGHVRDLPKSNKKAIDIDGGFIPHYEVSKGKEKVIAEIKVAAEKVDEVFLATDPDREGEAIAWHIKEVAGIKNPKRVVFHEITKEAIDEAIKHPRDIDENLRRAQEARRVLDRLVGYDLSGLIWKKVRYGLSAGRVQSPALRIIMEREREIRAFIPEKFWVITGEFSTRGGSGSAGETKKKERLQLTCDEELKSEAAAIKIISAAKEGEWNIVEIKETEAKRQPKAPFITSTLQQAASSRYGFSPSYTMSIAQKLYEQGLITYMRTDSVTISQTALKDIYKEIESEFGKDYLFPRTYTAKSKTAQEAHEPIRPTKVSQRLAGIKEEEKKLYRLIWERTVSSQMSDAKILRTKISANIIPRSETTNTSESTKNEIPNFSANGSVILFDGWLKADPDARGDDVELPKLKEGDDLKLVDIESVGKETEPPGRYTEAGLVKELEKREIGRPSTYATIIKTIIDRGYVEKINKSLHPTDTGDVVSTFLEKNFAEYISDGFTAEMENNLDGIAEGKTDYERLLKNFYGPFLKDVKAKSKSTEKITNLGDADPNIKCPVCGKQMVIKLAKNGKFLSCSDFPKCLGARKLDGSIMEGPKETGEVCPKCNAEHGGKLIEREGRFGKFIACSRYPKCKYIKKSPEEEAKGKTGVKCPECLATRDLSKGDKTGEITERRGRFGPFFSCSNYPTCKFAIKARPTGAICQMCGSLMMEGTKTIPERCSNKSCRNHNPHKLVQRE